MNTKLWHKRQYEGGIATRLANVMNWMQTPNNAVMRDWTMTHKTLHVMQFHKITVMTDMERKRSFNSRTSLYFSFHIPNIELCECVWLVYMWNIKWQNDLQKLQKCKNCWQRRRNSSGEEFVWVSVCVCEGHPGSYLHWTGRWHCHPTPGWWRWERWRSEGTNCLS